MDSARQVDKWDVIRLIVNSALNLTPEGAADLILNEMQHNAYVAEWVGRWINWLDEDFGFQVFEAMSSRQKVGV